MKKAILSTLFFILISFLSFANSKVELTEINYNSDSSTHSGNWFEIHNITGAPLSLNGWSVNDNSGVKFYFPSGITIATNGYLVVCDDTVRFKTIFPTVNNIKGNFTFSLSNSSDKIDITDNLGTKVYTMTYSDNYPWPKGADGYGRTLELTASLANPNLPASWFDGCMKGSPGVAYSPCNESIVFSEINYNSKATRNSGNWVELHNRTASSINISNWHLRGDTVTKDFTIPNNTSIAANGYLLIVSDTVAFKSQFPTTKNYVGQCFNFSNSKDKLMLTNSSKILKFTVCYRDSTPWPLKADGLGWSLELVSETGKMDEGSNWIAGCDGGSPGKAYPGGLAGGMDGTYTIGGTLPDYANLAAAVSDLNSSGVCGPVVFSIRNGTYSGAVSISQIAGASATNSITIQSSSGDSSSVTITNTSSTTSATNYTLQLYGSDYVTIKKLTLSRTGTNAYGNVLDIANAANSNTITGCRILGVKTTLTTANLNLISSIKYKDTGNVISGNYLKYGGYGIYFKSSGTTTYETGNKFIGNTIDSCFQKGIYLYAQKNSVVKSNSISRLVQTTGSAIYLTYLSSGNVVYNNKTNLRLGGYGVYTKYVSGTSASPNLIYNNFFVVGDTTVTGGNCYGLYLNDCYYLNAYNNSVNLITKKATTTGRGVYLTRDTTGTYGNVNVVNNIFMTTGGGIAIYVYKNAILKPYLGTVDYNNLYTKGKYIGYYGANATTFANWQTLSGKDVHSKNLSATFTSYLDLHCSTSGLDGVGTPVSSVKYDIDGQKRNTTTPDIGADEFGTGIPPSQQSETTAVNEGTNPGSNSEIRGWFNRDKQQIIAEINTNKSENYNILLTDLQGKIIKRTIVQTHPGLNTSFIDLQNNPMSVYLLMITNGQKVKTLKLLNY